MQELQENIINELIETLKENNIAFNINNSNTELVVRCKYCMDSLNKSHKHLYICIDKNSKRFLNYFCHKCNKKGIIDKEFISRYKIDINNKNIEDYLNQKNKDSKYNLPRKKYFKNFKIPITLDEIDKKKYNYFINRLGIKLNNNLINKFKIVTNVIEFLEINKINISKKLLSDKMLHFLDKDYIGFLSVDNAHLILRNINKDVDKKYRYYDLEFPIYNKDIESKKYYSIINEKFNYTCLIPNIIIAEGIFDIISIYNNFINKDNEFNNIYLAINGSNYYNVITDYIRRGYLTFNLEIYSDDDYNFNKYKKILFRLKNFYNKVNIYVNTIGKDFGESIDKIKINKIFNTINR